MFLLRKELESKNVDFTANYNGDLHYFRAMSKYFFGGLCKIAFNKLVTVNISVLFILGGLLTFVLPGYHFKKYYDPNYDCRCVKKE